MLILLSGEGATDMGRCEMQTHECEGANFRAGPMALLVDQVVARVWDYSPRDTGAFCFLSRSGLARYCKDNVRAVALPGKKRGPGMGGHFKHARGLARRARQRAQAEDSPVGAVLFRDSDGTNAAPLDLWERILHAIDSGFAAEEFEFGVAMVPRPKSEAWILCAVKANPYQGCPALEDAPGNDASPNSLKRRLDDVLAGNGQTVGDLNQMVEDGQIDALQIDMPSFHRFRARMETVALWMANGR
jgi:hypothetical protein